MGFTLHEQNTPVPAKAGSEIQSLEIMSNLISWEVSL